MEEFVYDEWGNPQTANFMDYAIPAASEFPSFDRIAMETPTDRNPLGVKGIGEAGTIGSTPPCRTLSSMPSSTLVCATSTSPSSRCGSGGRSTEPASKRSPDCQLDRAERAAGPGAGDHAGALLPM